MNEFCLFSILKFWCNFLVPYEGGVEILVQFFSSV